MSYWQEYERLKSDLGSEVLGLVEIGSRARGEAVDTSDHDLRVIIRSHAPYLLLQEQAWTEVSKVEITYIEWAALNQGKDATFGLTNLAFVAQAIEAGAYPLNDHTALYQGRIVEDKAGLVEKFKGQYAGVRFPNISNDYLRQTEWRVRQRWRAEIERALKGEGLDERKLAIPALHTACRIVRDIANIDAYRSTATYLADARALENYYQAQWAWFWPTFRKLFDYKTKETSRRTVFQQIQRGDSEDAQMLNEIQAETEKLWEQFKTRLNAV